MLLKQEPSTRTQLTPHYDSETPNEEPSPPMTRDELIRNYGRWLRREKKHRARHNSQQEIDTYVAEASRTIAAPGGEISLYAPYRNEYSALKTITRGQVRILCALLVLFVLGLIFFHVGMIIVVLAGITLLYLGDLVVNLLLSARTLDIPAEEHIDDEIVHSLADAEWPRYTILCPLYREAEIVPQFVQAMQALDYPQDKLQILLLTEQDDAETRRTMEEMHLPGYFEIVTVPEGKPRTKPRACNYGLLRASGDYVVIYDAEDVPDPLQLKKAVLAFANQPEETACIQAKLNFYNAEQNLLTRWFTAEYSLWFDLTLPGLQRMGVPLPLGGTSNHFRTHLLRRLGAWDAYNVTEDCDLGLRMAFYGYKTAVLDSTTYEEANSQFGNWIRQRSRWIKGYMQTYLIYMRNPRVYFHRPRLMEFISLQLFVGGKTGVLFINPLMWLLVGVYFLFRSRVDGFYHTLFPTPVLYMGMTCFIFGNFFYTYAHFIGCMRRGHYQLVKWTAFIPIYWAMASIAAYKALQQLIFNPHYWEKTQHGLHLRTAGTLPTIRTISEVMESAQPVLQEPAERDMLDFLASNPAGQDFAVVATHITANSAMEADEDDDDFDFAVTLKVKRVNSKKLPTQPLPEVASMQQEHGGQEQDLLASIDSMAPTEISQEDEI